MNARFIGFRLRDRGKARAGSRHSDGTLSEMCYGNARVVSVHPVASSCTITRVAYAYARRSRRLNSKRVYREFTLASIRRTQTASQFLRAITPVDYNYEVRHRARDICESRCVTRRSLDKAMPERDTFRTSGRFHESFSSLYKLTNPTGKGSEIGLE